MPEKKTCKQCEHCKLSRNPKWSSSFYCEEVKGHYDSIVIATDCSNFSPKKPKPIKAKKSCGACARGGPSRSSKYPGSVYCNANGLHYDPEQGSCCLSFVQKTCTLCRFNRLNTGKEVYCDQSVPCILGSQFKSIPIMCIVLTQLACLYF